MAYIFSLTGLQTLIPAVNLRGSNSRFVGEELCVKTFLDYFFLVLLNKLTYFLSSCRRFTFMRQRFFKIIISLPKLLLLRLLFGCILFIFFMKKQDQFGFLSEFTHRRIFFELIKKLKFIKKLKILLR